MTDILNQTCTPFKKSGYNYNQGYPNNVISLMSLRLKVAENQLEPLEISFTIQGLRVSTTMQKYVSATRSQFYLSESHSLPLEAVLLSRVSVV